ncbi:MAG: HAD family hydrolase [Acidobacteria bacterium]|nr:HAD family hydrolase [Acidobacteriota bacterium]
MAIKDGFAWDRQDAYLFDIDGTLLRSRDRVHVDSFTSTLQKMMGPAVTLEGVALAGNTDTSILREACAQAGITPEVLEPQLAAITEAICHNVAGRKHEMQPMLMPGVEDTLQHLADRGAILGLATGNLEMIGWIKMERAGLREWFRFGGFSDKFPLRAGLVGDAAKKARELAGPVATVCVVGDTPRDIEAAHANNLPVLAVATGQFSFDDLMQHQPEVCTTSLADLLRQTRERT